MYSFSIVALLPPAPAALVPAGRKAASFADASFAARRLMRERTPPGGAGDVGRSDIYTLRWFR